MVDYYYTQGKVVLDAGAAQHLRTLPLWAWLQNQYPAQGGLTICFPETWERKIGRHHINNLAQAQSYGKVTGETLNVSNAAWEAAVFHGDTFWYGSSDCLNVPVVLAPAQFAEIQIIGGPFAFCMKKPKSKPEDFELSRLKGDWDCHCKGWDLRKDLPACYNAPPVLENLVKEKP